MSDEDGSIGHIYPLNVQWVVWHAKLQLSSILPCHVYPGHVCGPECSLYPYTHSIKQVASTVKNLGENRMRKCSIIQTPNFIKYQLVQMKQTNFEFSFYSLSACGPIPTRKGLIIRLTKQSIFALYIIWPVRVELPLLSGLPATTTHTCYR